MCSHSLRSEPFDRKKFSATIPHGHARTQKSGGVDQDQHYGNGFSHDIKVDSLNYGGNDSGQDIACAMRVNGDKRGMVTLDQAKVSEERTAMCRAPQIFTIPLMVTSSLSLTIFSAIEALPIPTRTATKKPKQVVT